jgi:cytochrome b
MNEPTGSDTVGGMLTVTHPEPVMVRVWDPVVRIFHWTVVVGCVLDLFVLEGGGTAHNVVGYVVAGALAIRMVWGFIGSGYARFSDFVPSPGRLARYIRALAAGRGERYVGHNPAGAIMILMLMALLAGVSVTGWMLTLDAFWGSEALEEIHGAISNAILILALTHVAAALFESFRHKENLVKAMITGDKRA